MSQKELSDLRNASDDYIDVVEHGWHDAVYEQGEQWTNPPRPVVVEQQAR